MNPTKDLREKDMMTLPAQMLLCIFSVHNKHKYTNFKVKQPVHVKYFGAPPGREGFLIRFQLPPFCSFSQKTALRDLITRFWLLHFLK
jgi:hypothetical protein